MNHQTDNLDKILAEVQQLSESLLNDANKTLEPESPTKNLSSQKSIKNRPKTTKVIPILSEAFKPKRQQDVPIYQPSQPIPWTSSMQSLLNNNDGVCLLKLYLNELDEKISQNKENYATNSMENTTSNVSYVDLLNSYFAYKGYHQSFDSYTNGEKIQLARIIYKRYIKKDQKILKLLKSRNANCSKITANLFNEKMNLVRYFLQENIFSEFLRSPIFLNYCLEIEKSENKQHKLNISNLPKLDEKPAKTPPNRPVYYGSEYYQESKMLQQQQNQPQSLPKTSFHLPETSPYYIPENYVPPPAQKLLPSMANQSINYKDVTFSEFSDLDTSSTSKSCYDSKNYYNRNYHHLNSSHSMVGYKQPNYYYKQQLNKYKKQHQNSEITSSNNSDFHHHQQQHQSQHGFTDSNTTKKYHLKSKKLQHLQNTLQNSEQTVKFDLEPEQHQPSNFNDTFNSSKLSKNICYSESETNDSSKTSNKNKETNLDNPKSFKPPPLYQMEMATKHPKLFSELLIKKLNRVVEYRQERMKLKSKNVKDGSIYNLNQQQLNRTQSNISAGNFSKHTTATSLNNQSSNNSVGPSISNAEVRNDYWPQPKVKDDMSNSTGSAFKQPMLPNFSMQIPPMMEKPPVQNFKYREAEKKSKEDRINEWITNVQPNMEEIRELKSDLINQVNDIDGTSGQYETTVIYEITGQKVPYKIKVNCDRQAIGIGLY